MSAKNDSPVRIGRRWIFPDGATVPFVSGGATEEGVPNAVELPEDLTTVEVEALDGYEAALIAEFDRLHDEGSTDVVLLTEIADGLDAVRAERTRRDEVAAEAEAARAALRERVHAADAAEGDEGDEGDDSADEGESDDAEASSEAPEPVTAAAPRPAAPARRAPAAATARRAGRPAVQEAAPVVTITAAADLPGVATGSRIDLMQVARSFGDRARSLRNGSPRVPVATFALPFAAGDVIRKATSDDSAVAIMDRVADPASLDLTTLTAAGGWCTPSQNLYDLLELDGATGLLNLPTVGVERGGLNVPGYIGIDSADGALWVWGEDADAATALTFTDIDIAGNVATVSTAAPHLLVEGDTVEITSTAPGFNGVYTVASVVDADTFTVAVSGVATATNATGVGTRQKGCFTIPCPTWDDVRLAAYGLCLSHGNLMDRAFPELTKRYISLVMNAHQHRMSAINIAKIASAANSQAVTVTAAGTDSYGELMSAVELSAVDYRSQHKISDRVVLEILLPTWTKEVLRSNLAMRAGVDLLSVTDSQIAQYFADRNVRPQFLEDYQPMWNGTPRVLWPTTIEFVIYPAGGFISGNGGKIDLGVVRDSRLNATNDFTAAWSEEFNLLARRGPLARKVTATLDTNGVTGCCP